MEIALDWIATILALVAIILSILVARLALSQTQDLHDDNNDLAMEEFERQRFDVMFAANDQVLESVADFKADIIAYLSIDSPYWDAKRQSGESVDYLISVHRSMERFFARRKSLDVALSGLPSYSKPGRGIAADPELATQGQQLRYASSWLLGCIMATYHSHVTGALVGGEEGAATVQAVVNSITSELDRESFPTLEAQRTYSQEAARNWQHSARSAAEDRVGNGKGSALTAAQAATRFLNEAEDQLHEATKTLAATYTATRYATSVSLRRRRRSSRWLNVGPYRSRV